ncbi:hypothetical protein BT93_G0916 [Corymbia citriodora subsp. variegata]|nr:hypothetical protein BT93_G0916 [Corymbia citriodora subsp. variegata]
MHFEVHVLFWSRATPPPIPLSVSVSVYINAKPTLKTFVEQPHPLPSLLLSFLPVAMEALSFLRLLWKPTSTTIMPDETRSSTAETDYGSDDEDDSFFELELAHYVTDSDSKGGTDSSAAAFVKSNNGIRQTGSADAKTRDASRCFSADKPAVSLSQSPTALFSKRKILPVETASQPQSPVSLFKSSPKLRVLMFRRSRSKSVAAPNVKAEETQETELKKSASSSVFFAVKPREVQPPPPATDDAWKKQNKNKQTTSPSRGKLAESFFSEDSASKRLSKDGLQKYLNLVKPLSVGISKRYSDTFKFPSAESPLTSPVSSPAATVTAAVSSPRMGKVFRVRPKQLLGKSKSATLATTSATSSPARRDGSLDQQHDGIQGAILHCKKSYYSSRDGSVLWRSASDPSSHGKSMDSV